MPLAEREVEVKYAKGAVVVAASVMALGIASPAMAAPAHPVEHLLDANTVSKADVKNPLGDLDVHAFVNSVSKVADKLSTKNDTSAKTKIGDISAKLR